jgi:hypothetical protein
MSSTPVVFHCCCRHYSFPSGTRQAAPIAEEGTVCGGKSLFYLLAGHILDLLVT